MILQQKFAVVIKNKAASSKKSNQIRNIQSIGYTVKQDLFSCLPVHLKISCFELLFEGSHLLLIGSKSNFFQYWLMFYESLNK